MVLSCFFFFFFSSRRRHTRCSRDWSSDVCSSDLLDVVAQARDAPRKFAAVTAAATELELDMREVEQIGRASCRERGEISVGAVSLKKKKKKSKKKESHRTKK